VAGALVIVAAAVVVGILLGRGPSPAALTGSAVLDTRPKPLAAATVLSATAVPLAAPDVRPAEHNLAAHDAGTVIAPAANPAPAPSSEPAKKHHRERRSPEGGEPLPL